MKRFFNTYLLVYLIIITLSLFINVDKVLGQEMFSTYEIDDIVEQFVDYDEDNPINVDEIKKQLSYLAEHPIDINTATREELEQLPFLNPLQVEKLLLYVYAYGPMKSLNELRLVEGMDLSTIQMLTMFLTIVENRKTIENQSIKNRFKFGKSELINRFSTTTQQKKGYEKVSDSIRNRYPGSYYLGQPFYNSLRYSFSYKNLLSIGFAAEKDMGEEFFKGTNKKGYDFYSFHFFMRDVKWLKALAIGSYKASFGKGLVISNDYYMGKSTYSSAIINRKNGLRAHTSTDEINFLQGAGMTAAVGKTDISIFYSFRPLDAVVENEFVTSLKKDGYHRLIREIESRNSIINHLIGNNIRYNSQFFNIELTTVYNKFNKMLNPDIKPYNIFYPRGDNFLNIGAAYNLRWKNIFAGGEIATDKNGKLAFINSLNFYPYNDFRIYLLYRYYDPEYTSINASSFVSGSGVQNEHGVYFGLEARLFNSVKMNISFDSYKFPWLRYNIDTPSSGEELTSRITFTPISSLTLYADYRYKKYATNYKNVEKEKHTGYGNYNKIKLYCGYKPNDKFSMNTYLNINYATTEQHEKSKGFALTQSFSYKAKRIPVQASAVYSIFQTDDYNSRIYIASKNLPYTFYFPAMFGRGIHFAGVLRYDYKKLMTIALRYSITQFENVEKIGSGAEEINGDKRDDLSFMLVFKF